LRPGMALSSICVPETGYHKRSRSPPRTWFARKKTERVRKMQETPKKQKELVFEWPVTVFLALVAVTLLSCAKSDPRLIAGSWVTDVEPYQESSIEIDMKTIVFRDPLLPTADICVITHTSIEEGDQTSMITIEYVNAQRAKFKRTIIYWPRDGGCFWFKNQPSVIWKRAKSGAVSGSVRRLPEPGLSLQEVFA
jgi:hypothetical protein